jgi:hypothetical protein
MRLSLGRMATAMVVGVVLLTLAGTPGALAQTSPTSPQTRVAERHQTALEASGSGVATMSVGCYGDTCSGKDPQAMGCLADARTLASYRRVPDAYSDDDWLVELRYSHNCQAQWTRGTVYYMSTYFGLDRCTTLGATSCGRLYTKYAMADYTGGAGWWPVTVWTPMLSRYRGHAPSCGLVVYRWTDQRVWRCTAIV